MKNRIKILKNEKGSITTVVLVTILFFITILSTAYAITSVLRQTQLKSQLNSKEGYEKDIENVDKIYNELTEKWT